MTTLNDVATEAGVSVSAVSRVLAGSPTARVSEATRERIFAAAEALDYRPNFAARALKASRTHVLGLVVPDLTNAIFADMVRGVEEEASARDYMMLLARAEAVGSSETAIRKLIGEGRVDGVILQVHDGMPPEEVGRLAEADLPIVFMNSSQIGSPGSVIFDDATAVGLATDHLVKLGHTRIALIGGLRTTASAARRHAGFVASMERAGIPIDDALVTWRGYERTAGGDALAEVMNVAEPPTAIVAANLNAALGALVEARRRGLSIPEDVSLVAIHDSWTAETSWPPLTTVRMPWMQLGHTAVRLLLARIDEGVAPDEVVSDPPPELIVRESTAPPPTVYERSRD